MKIELSLIGETHSDKANRKNISSLVEIVMEDEKKALFYEHTMYLLTPEKHKKNGLYGLDDLIFKVFSQFILTASYLLKKDGTKTKEYLSVASKEIQKYIKMDKKIIFYDQKLDLIKKCIQAVEENNKFDDSITGLLNLADMVYSHPKFSIALKDNSKRQKAGLKFDLLSMKKLFNGWKDTNQKNEESISMGDIKEEIIGRLRNVVFGENIKDVINKNNNLTEVIAVVGSKHLSGLAKYIASDDLNIKTYENYDAYFEATKKSEVHLNMF